MSIPALSVVIPVFNSENSLRPLISKLGDVLPRCVDEYEVILVNDASRDGSSDVVQELSTKHDWVRGIDLSRNYGQHNAILCGLRTARFPITATMDDDLQNPPEELPKLLETLSDGYDVVYGVPEKQKQTRWRAFASSLIKYALHTVMGVEYAQEVSAYRVFRTDLRESFAHFSGAFVSIDVLLTWATTKFAGVTVRHEPRAQGRSNYTIGKLITHALNLVTGFSILPLRIASIIGFIFTLFGMAVLAYILIRFSISGRVVPGFAFLGSSIAIFSGAQLCCLGIIGEYLARIHFRTIGRPSYTIRREWP